MPIGSNSHRSMVTDCRSTPGAADRCLSSTPPPTADTRRNTATLRRCGSATAAAVSSCSACRRMISGRRSRVRPLRSSVSAPRVMRSTSRSPRKAGSSAATPIRFINGSRQNSAKPGCRAGTFTNTWSVPTAGWRAPGHLRSLRATARSPPRSSGCCKHPSSGGSRFGRRDPDRACGRQIAGARYRANHEHVTLAANLDLVAWECGKIEAGAQHRLLRHDELAAISFCQGFKAARGVDRVAYRGHRDGAAVAHLADDCRPDVDADTDAHRLVELAAQRSIELHQALRHQPGGIERGAAGGPGVALDPEQCHDPVTDEFVDPPAGRLDGASHRREISVEHEYYVIREPTLGEAGEAANVGEQDSNLALAALRE